MRAALFSYVWRRGEQCHGADSCPGEPTPVGASWRVLCSYKSGFEGGGVVVGCLAAAAGRFEGAANGGSVCGTVAVVAASRPRALQQRRGCRHSARRGAAVAGMAALG
jgi:hypothetical protein